MQKVKLKGMDDFTAYQRIRRIIHGYHLFKCPSLSAVLIATTILMKISIVPTRTEPETFSATPSKTKTMAVL